MLEERMRRLDTARAQRPDTSYESDVEESEYTYVSWKAERHREEDDRLLREA